MKFIHSATTIETDYPDYLRDESRVTAPRADALAWPENEQDVVDALADARSNNRPVTISAARTGIVAAAVPMCGGMILSMERMARVKGLGFDTKSKVWHLTVEPGVLLADIQQNLHSRFSHIPADWTDESKQALETMKTGNIRLFYPPDPTEMSAAIGGTAATNASGARTFKYGATRDYVRRIRVVLADGAILDIRRGCVKAGKAQSIVVPPDVIVNSAGNHYEIPVPTYTMPPTKHCAGYFAAPDMDLIDFFIGSEGTLGVITELELKLLEQTKELLCILAFFDGEEQSLRFVKSIRQAVARNALDVEAIEFFGANALQLLRDRHASGDTEIPGIPKCDAAVYVELAFDEEAMEETYELLDECLEQCGSSAEGAWAGMEEAEIEKMKTFRHAVPETINQIIGERKRALPALHKIATDLAVPEACLLEMLAFYHEKLKSAELEYAIFGHIGNSHLHVNMLPRNEDELSVAEELYARFAEKAVELGGTVAAEHGIGKLKRQFLKTLYGQAGVGEMRAVKTALDPAGMLGKGTLL